MDCTVEGRGLNFPGAWIKNWKKKILPLSLPWVPETFNARFSGFRQIFIVTRAESYAARDFGIRPKMCRPAAAEASRRTRETTSGTQGTLSHKWLCMAGITK